MSPLVLLVPVLLLLAAAALLAVRHRRLTQASALAEDAVQRVRARREAAITALRHGAAVLRDEGRLFPDAPDEPPVVEPDPADPSAADAPLGGDADRRKDARRRSPGPRARRAAPDPAPPSRP
jgi:hypothetical protein